MQGGFQTRPYTVIGGTPDMKRYDPEVHHRRSIRLNGYDYAQAGAYFVTVCTDKGKCVLADAELKGVVEEEWIRTGAVRPGVMLDEFVVMPNHIHGIIVIVEGRESNVGARRCLAQGDPSGRPYRAPPTGPEPSSVGAMIGQFKSVTAKRINRVLRTPGMRLWQRNYYERVIRNEGELNAIRQYIHDNPVSWETDRENPARRETNAVEEWLYGARECGHDQ